MRSRLFGKGS